MIHPTAIVDSRARIDESAEIGPFCTIGPEVSIGQRSKLLSHVVVTGNTHVGGDNVIFPFAVIGGVPQDLKYRGEDTKLVLGDHNIIRESVTINVGTAQGGGITEIGSHNLIMAYTHIAHDCRVGNHCVIANNVQIAGHVVIEDYVIIGGTVAIVQFIRVGTHSYVGGSLGLEMDVPPYSVIRVSRPVYVKGANLVGLKRRGFTPDTVRSIHEALKMWAKSENQRDVCIGEIEARLGHCEEVRQLIDFIKKSETGVIRSAANRD